MQNIIEKITDFDISVLMFIREHIAGEPLDYLMRALTFISDNGLIWIALALLLLCFPRWRVTGLKLILGLAIFHLVCNLGLKLLIQRARPFTLVEGLKLLIEAPTDYSFPSGHTMSSAMCAVILLHDDRRIGIPASVLAFAIGCSRLYMFVHFPTDVLAGALLGILLGWGINKVADIVQSKAEREAE